MNVFIPGLPKSQWRFILHTEEKNCHRCSVSTRPVCCECGHSLSGQVFKNSDGIDVTTCEVCCSLQDINSYA